MTKQSLINQGDAPHVERINRPGNEVTLGQWVWVTPKEGVNEWFGCITHIGTNYINVEGLSTGRGHHSVRVHFNEMGKHIQLEEDPQHIIQSTSKEIQAEIARLMDKAKEITSRLGFQQEGISYEPHNDTKELAIWSDDNLNVDQYKKDLVQAKEVLLPEIFKEIKVQNEVLAGWMGAEAMALKVLSSAMQGDIAKIDDRIFNVSLYAGLTEETAQCCDGEKASIDEKLHLMQRKLYIDEECLLGYKNGGIDITDLNALDTWISQKENYERILPFPKCITAMQLRRNIKDREHQSLSQANINVQLSGYDTTTFLFVRNGNAIYRMNCDLAFGAFIFPDEDMLGVDEPMMFKMFASRVDRIITRREFDVIDLDRESSRSSERWHDFNSDSVYFDDVCKELADRAKKYNHIGVIIQGLLDRSEILHPHPPVKLWEPASFNHYVKLIRDGAKVLHHGDTPDFEQYRQQCNSQITKDSILTGQHQYWLKAETQKESDRMDKDWRHRDSDYRPTTFKPFGNPGPEFVSPMSHWQPRAKKATFSWFRERINQGYYGENDGPIKTKVTVPVEHLFNVSAYKKGDFKQFFADPRTRQQYLKWAPMLIAAEEYVCSN